MATIKDITAIIIKVITVLLLSWCLKCFKKEGFSFSDITF